ncbi:hypothetical protein SARC_07234 [Sphaeroforma arctica JP610]|uniref:Cytosol aminopeptidase domain-containing protein n=1 Tax=Sphaeroforma arctica JP610 TaxID=667725 RepID=A0A0L0FU80_9EUKA|nr:hypothetical protein SARC_07234 [Sphaeroforma arctica JP610]KNC80405.1 hypothetical protein SARC_07234 [Sphaeroforma arctica JP610]|eukprot:XP_014154307.1 hypothetical protein SARC_07234 [Sphaeroforma arctica JP610]
MHSMPLLRISRGFAPNRSSAFRFESILRLQRAYASSLQHDDEKKLASVDSITDFASNAPLDPDTNPTIETSQMKTNNAEGVEKGVDAQEGNQTEGASVKSVKSTKKKKKADADVSSDADTKKPRGKSKKKAADSAVDEIMPKKKSKKKSAAPAKEAKDAATTEAASRNTSSGLVLGVHVLSKKQTTSTVLTKTDKGATLAPVDHFPKEDREKEGFSLALENAVRAGFNGKVGEVVLSPTPVAHGEQEYSVVAVAGLGSTSVTKKPNADFQGEGVVDAEENVRLAVAKAVKKLRTSSVGRVDVDPMNHPEAAGEGAALGLYTYDALKAEKNWARYVEVAMFRKNKTSIPVTEAAFNRGAALGEAQNIARRLMDTPANLMTPTVFVLEAQKMFASHEQDLGRLELKKKGTHWTTSKKDSRKEAKAVSFVDVRVYDFQWALDQNMGAFLSVDKGSNEPLRFLEVEYINKVPADYPPVVMVGKGVTFDSGGISIKPSAGMDLMKGDMGGAATVLGAMYGLHRLGVKGRFIACIPLCENMPGGNAVKPGDVVTARNGLTITVDNTDAEGRLILCDALHYAEEAYKPSAIMSVATLTGAIDVALGAGAAGVFCKSNKMWDCLDDSGYVTGERLWRMPTYNHYDKQMTGQVSDLINAGGRSAGACTAAAFLRNFVSPTTHYAHVDIAGVMHSPSDGKTGCASPYLSAGMQGRPTRAFVAFCKKWVEDQVQKV